MAKHSKLQTSIEYAAARVILSTVGALPIKQSLRLGQLLGRVAYLFAGELRRTGDINLKLAFTENTAAETRELLTSCFQSLGRELGLFSHFPKNSGKSVLSVVEPQGLECLAAAK